MTRRDSQLINEINDFREEAGHLAPNVDVQIGDKLKIYFDKQDSNVTYEAKVSLILLLEKSIYLYVNDYSIKKNFNLPVSLFTPQYLLHFLLC